MVNQGVVVDEYHDFVEERRRVAAILADPRYTGRQVWNRTTLTTTSIPVNVTPSAGATRPRTGSS